uniref:Uncharacterized protein n=1 Tax=Arion vulgaris TaxID=1028688 RepID=A0A0B6Z7P3_9EUPU
MTQTLNHKQRYLMLKHQKKRCLMLKQVKMITARNIKKVKISPSKIKKEKD